MSGLIPQGFINDLLNRTDLVEVISSRVPLKKTGKNYSARCPFHDEKSPSFSVNPEKQFYYCFGCGASGNAIGFLMHYDNLEFPQAVEDLAGRIGLEVPRETSEAHTQKIDKAAPLYDVLHKASEFYRQALKQHPARHTAIEYLKGRGLSGTIARDFALGFAPPGWDHLMRQLGQTPEQQQHLLDAGLIIEHEINQKRYDRFRDRITFPIRDTRGRVLGFGGRVLGPEKPKYLNSPESPVFHKSQELYGLYELQKAQRNPEEIIVVEGYMDVIALAQQGLRNAVAVLGTATTEEHIRRLFRITSSILFCFDGDAAGKKAAWRALEACLPQLEDGRLVRFLFLPEGEDPDSVVRQEGTEKFKARIQQQAQTLADYCFEHCSSGINLRSFEGRAQLSAQVSPLIERIPGVYLKSLMRQHLAQLTGIALPQPETEASHTSSGSSSQTIKQAETPEPRYPYRTGSHNHRKPQTNQQGVHIEPPVISALRVLIRHPELASKAPVIEHIETEDQPTQLLMALVQQLQEQPSLNSLQLMARWHGTQQGRLLRTLAEKEWLITDDNLEQQFFDTINSLVIQQHVRNLAALQEKARHTELSSDEKNLLRTLLLQQVAPTAYASAASTKGQV